MCKTGKKIKIKINFNKFILFYWKMKKNNNIFLWSSSRWNKMMKKKNCRGNLAGLLTIYSLCWVTIQQTVS